MEGLVPSSSASVHRWKYDVFVSFRGGDIKKNFAAHLFCALKQAGICYFEDNDKEETGILIEAKLLDVIRHSRVSLVVFTTNYADSRWCLNELVEILECNRRFRDHQGHVLLPIFYDVEPRDVRKQSGRFGDGWHLNNDANGDQSLFIEQIVGRLLKIIPRRSSPYAIGVDSFVDDVISLLKTGSEDGVRVVGIWGIKGIGKTTVAKVVCDRLYREFKGVVSLLEILEMQTKNLDNYKRRTASGRSQSRVTPTRVATPFSKGQPKELSRSLVHYAGGLPMVLQRFGSLLSRKKNQWHEILEKLGRDPHLDSIGIPLDPFSSLRASVGPSWERNT
ncbi:hypothetical protein NL676_015878 [Syzygium grande]|nr:hypothetical protein NL676_015878 [Syzygium grande]